MDFILDLLQGAGLAAAVGIPDPNYGQDILACVVLKPGSACDEPSLRAHWKDAASAL